MADPQQVLAQRVRDAIVASSGPDYRDADPLIRPSAFADFQSNAALPLGKPARPPPRPAGPAAAPPAAPRTDPNRFYQAARRKFDTDPEFAEHARMRVVDLQGGDPATLKLWQELVDLSKDYLHRIYGWLGVTLTDDDIKGESFYNDMLADTVAQLEDQGIAVESDGALCAFPPGFTGREGRPMPVIIRKSDGGYNYSTTDLATIRYRVDVLHSD